jgi:hypothetical protein
VIQRYDTSFGEGAYEEAKGPYVLYSDHLEEIRVLREALREALKLAEQRHHYCEDSWYSCPKEPESGCADPRQGDQCNCGADETNAKIEELRKVHFSFTS